MALKQQGQQKARVSGHFDWPELPTLFQAQTTNPFGRQAQLSEAQKQESLRDWYEQVKESVQTKLEELADKTETLSSQVDDLRRRVEELETT